MPAGDRTGPAGWGPMTGRGAGFCVGQPVPGFMNPAWWRSGGGRGWGRGGGWRHRHWYYATGVPGWHRAVVGWPAYAAPFGPRMTQEQELEALKNQARYFQQALDDLRNRISEVQSSASGSKTT